MIEARDVTEGLWLWRQPHPEWAPHLGWEPPVTSFCVTARDTTVVLDALAPPRGDPVWERLDGLRPSAAVVLKPDHTRDARLVNERYGATVYGAIELTWEQLERVEPFEETAPGSELPAGIVLLDDGRWRRETPAYLRKQRALVFADGLVCDAEGVLRVWATPWHERRVLPALRAIVDGYDFEHVLVSHGEPMHTRAELEAALERPPYTG
jgi:hypothetical protein